MRNKDIIAYLGLWDKFFKGVEFDAFKMKMAIIKLKYRQKSGLKKQMQ